MPSNIFKKNIFFEFQAADHQFSTQTLELHANPLKKLFYSYTYGKTYLAVRFKSVFLSICWQESYEFKAKVLPVCWKYKRGFHFLSLHKIKMSKQHRLFISYIQGCNVNHISKVFTCLSTPPMWEQGIPCQLSKRISKLFFQMSAQENFVFGQTEGRRKAVLEWGKTVL